MDILLLAYESDFNNYTELYGTLSDDGHNVSIIICDFFSPITGNDYAKKGLINGGVPERNIYDLKEEIVNINNYQESDEIYPDYKFLNSLEEKFTNNRVLSHLIYADIYLCGFLHKRDNVYRSNNKEILYLFIEKLIKKIDLHLKEISPDLIYTFGAYNFIKNYIYEKSLVLDVKHVSLFSTRINNLCILSNNSCFGTVNIIKREMDRLIGNQKTELFNEAEDYITSIRIKNNAAYDISQFEYINNLNEKFSFWYQVKPLFRAFLSLPRAFWNDRVTSYRGIFNSNYFYLKSVFYMYYINVRTVFRNRSYFNNKDLNHMELPKCDYIFYPLQTLPEDVGFTQKDLHDELCNIMRLSKIIPINCKIVVKPHSTMLVRDSYPHPINWYNKINEMHNVHFVSPLLNGIDVIKDSKAVAAVYGTSLFEASIMGKAAFTFGNPEFEILDGVYKFNEDTFLDIFRNHTLSEVNNHKYYIQAVFNKGIDIEYDKYLFTNTEISQSKEYKNKFIKPIKKHLYDVMEDK
jgi:hypothetical protein